MKWITEVMEDNAKAAQKEALKNLKNIKMDNNLPRRIHIDKYTAAEKAIYDAIQEVEKAGADVRLTESVILLQKAKDKVSDFVDGIE